MSAKTLLGEWVAGYGQPVKFDIWEQAAQAPPLDGTPRERGNNDSSSLREFGSFFITLEGPVKMSSMYCDSFVNEPASRMKFHLARGGSLKRLLFRYTCAERACVIFP